MYRKKGFPTKPVKHTGKNGYPTCRILSHFHEAGNWYRFFYKIGKKLSAGKEANTTIDLSTKTATYKNQCFAAE